MIEPKWQQDKVTLYLADCLELMGQMPENSVDAIVTDPPYGLSFMGKDWDHGCPGVPFWVESLWVAKPGAHLLAFGGTRTFHRLTCAIEDAGWEIRDCVMWVYGQGFPKSHDVSKAIDKMAGAERQVVGPKVYGDGHIQNHAGGKPGYHEWKAIGVYEDDKPTTPAAVQWQGWGTALKPAWEPIIVARKPVEGTVAANVTEWGTGAINVGGCRIESSYSDSERRQSKPGGGRGGMFMPNGDMPAGERHNLAGRWPANVVHDGGEEVLALFPTSSITGNRVIKDRVQQEAVSTPFTRGQFAPEYTDSGSTARFFYCAKASRQDREEGCEGLEEHIKAGSNGVKSAAANGDDYFEPGSNTGFNVVRRTVNHHPTVKPTPLMRWLCRLITPPGGIILDPFMGSGSTGKAAILEGFQFVGIDNQPEYVEIAIRRIQHATLQPQLAL